MMPISEIVLLFGSNIFIMIWFLLELRKINEEMKK